VRRARDNKWRADPLLIDDVLAGELELEHGDPLVRFCGRDLGLIDRDLCFLSERSAAPAASRGDNGKSEQAAREAADDRPTLCLFHREERRPIASFRSKHRRPLYRLAVASVPWNHDATAIRLSHREDCEQSEWREAFIQRTNSLPERY
jgi:hypothetical protein